VLFEEIQNAATQSAALGRLFSNAQLSPESFVSMGVEGSCQHLHIYASVNASLSANASPRVTDWLTEVGEIPRISLTQEIGLSD
jgi:hypothetical protein